MLSDFSQSEPRDFFGPYLIRSRNINLAWRTYINTILKRGIPVITEDKRQSTKETFCSTVHLTDYESGEKLPSNYIGLSTDVVMEQYIPQYISDSRGTHTYTYGWCMRKRFGHDQSRFALEELKHGATSAFCQFWNPVEDLYSPNPPCINIVLYYADHQNEKVHIIVFIRSNDMGRAHSEDLVGINEIFLKHDVAMDLFGSKHSAGTLTSISCSAHVYDTAVETIEKATKFSISLANSAQKINEFTIPGPVLLRNTHYHSIMAELEHKLEKYSTKVSEKKKHLFVIFRLEDFDETDGENSTALKRFAEDTVNGKNHLGKNLRRFEGKPDNKDEWISIDQLAHVKKKIEKKPESRRIIITPNNPFKKDFSLNPLIVQILPRFGKAYTAALFREYDFKDIEKAVYLIRKIQEKVVAGTQIRPGPIAMYLFPLVTKF